MMIIVLLRKYLLAAFCLMMLLQAFGQNKKPNIIFILTDDQGYGDMACHGNPYINTPNIDQLHNESACFTNFHVGTTCAPSRATLLSGQYSNRVGAWHTIKGREILSHQVPTLASVLKDAGYRTGIFGKWHLGDAYPYRPQDRGFEEVVVHKAGGVGQSPDYWDNDYFDDVYYHNGKPEHYKGYCTDVWFEQATRFIQENKDKPFFCYLPLNAPHGPFIVDPKYSDPYKNNKNIPNANFYGMITNLDEHMGKLRKKLAAMGLAENTIFIFMTDNGTAGGVSFDKNGEVRAGYNAGMRGTKGSPYEGGHRVPFLLHWPAGNINKAAEIHTLVANVDFMPTILDLCNVQPRQHTLFDGMSLRPLLLKTSASWPQRTLVVDTQREEFLIKNKEACVMDDQWRLIKNGDKIALYNLANDPGQQQDVKEKYPDKAAKLNEGYENWWQSVSVNADTYNRYVIGSKKEKKVALNSHDAHSVDSNPAWNQQLVREGITEHGYYSLSVARNGNYIIELSRWPEESKLAINEAAPATEPVPGGFFYPKGNALNYVAAQIQIGDRIYKKQIEPGSTKVRFEIPLKKGDLDLTASFITQDKKLNNAYYVYITKK